MPMDQPEMERRNVSNTNDILSIYDLLSGMDATLAKHTIQLRNLGNKLEAHDQRFDAIDGRFDAIDGRFTKVDGRFTKVDATLAEILRRLPE